MIMLLYAKKFFGVNSIMNECKCYRTKTVNDGYAPGGGDKKVFFL